MDYGSLPSKTIEVDVVGSTDFDARNSNRSLFGSLGFVSRQKRGKRSKQPPCHAEAGDLKSRNCHFRAEKP